ncbi:MAG TPA: hypothetical protein VGS57_01955 [Thermoanaerobaculia bacterium]|jgi:hypothetical protein|nr:hypothetical protein [Thermoanaerobaculia bacterium]
MPERITEEQAKAYKIIADIGAKVWLVLLAGFVYLGLAVALIFFCRSWPIALVESFLTGTLYPVFWHFFPSKKLTATTKQ